MVPNQDHYAIVVGITDYAGFPVLSAAEGDAIAFANWLCDPNGGDIPPSQVRVIVSSGRPVPGKSYYPIKDDIDDALRTIISKQAGRIGKRFYFYFSGHGCTPSADEILLLMANATADSMRRNIGPDPYRKWLTNGALFDEILFILDCCLGSDTAPVSGEPVVNCVILINNLINSVDVSSYHGAWPIPEFPSRFADDIWLFSSTERTTAWAGGSTQRPTMSLSFSTNSGSFDSLNVRIRCGASW